MEQKLPLEQKSPNNKKSNENIYINGKGQIIEMLKIMPMAEKMKLLKNIGLRNAPMARELSEESLSFASMKVFGLVP